MQDPSGGSFRWVVGVLAMFAVGVCFFGGAEAKAETLDESSITAFYADQSAVMREGTQVQVFLQTRLDDGFTLQQNGVETINDAPPKQLHDTFSKAQTIENSVRGANAMHVEALDNKVTAIQYSDDHKIAYVSDTTTSYGIVTFPLPDGTSIPEHYQDGEGCVDKLTLVAATIRIMQSACNDKLLIMK